MFLNINIMNNSVNQRFQSVVSEKSKSVSEFSRMIGVGQTTLNSQLNGPRGVSLETIIATLIAFPDISSQWLLLGKGCMHVTDNAALITGTESDAQLDVIADNARLVAECEEKDRRILILEDRCQWLKEYNEQLIRASSSTENYKKHIS
jgi:hypothetical protein